MLGAAALIAVAGFPGTSAAQTLITLYSFAGGTDGSQPVAGVIADASGNLYGTTVTGGAHNSGTVFKVTATGTETVLYSFTGGSDGSQPFAGLIADASGNLYGTTNGGGASGNGTVFKVTPSGTETVLYSFTGGSDGSNPRAGLIADASGNLYGTTSFGGTTDNGTVFGLTGTGAVEFNGIPGMANCNGQTTSNLANTYGGIAHAAAMLGFASVPDLKNAITTYCSG
jgi:uncharacterized repeat protein (TIGR03803 family)